MLARGKCAARSMEELRRAALSLLTGGDAEAASELAGRAAALDPLDEGAQELFLRHRPAPSGRKPGQPASWHVRCCSRDASRRAMRRPSAASESVTANAGPPSCPGRRPCERSAWPLPGAAAKRDDAENAFALACQLGDPCWEGMAGRAMAMLALQAGDGAAAADWITEARRRCDRVPDRYVWVSGFVGLGQLEIAARQQRDLVVPLARRLYRDALRADLPEFVAWALIYQAEAGELANLPMARTLAASIANPALQARTAALEATHA
jgi:hypothetical protein